MRTIVLAAVRMLPATFAAAQALRNADSSFRPNVDSWMPSARGGSGAPPANDPTGRRVVQQRVGGSADVGNHAPPSNQGIAARVANSVPRGPVPNEANPR